MGSFGDESRESFEAKSLKRDVDYLFCPSCQKHVPCLRTELGWFEVQCPQCLGECGICKCPLREFCFGVNVGAGPIPPEAVTPDCPYDLEAQSE